MTISNPKLASHRFLASMYVDDYFPRACVDKVAAILVALCERIEREQPKDLGALYRLTHAATDQINDLEDEFLAHDSEIETAAREEIITDLETIATAYGFAADPEELAGTRNW
jgi:hypothetical protein